MMIVSLVWLRLAGPQDGPLPVPGRQPQYHLERLEWRTLKAECGESVARAGYVWSNEQTPPNACAACVEAAKKRRASQ